MKIGYARVSTVDQKARLQTDALRKAGCRTIYVDQGRSGASINRPELKKALKRLKHGDVLVVWKLDRLGRSLRHLIDLVEEFRQRKIGLRSLTDCIDTTSPQGRMVFQIMGSLAEFERELTIERTRAGLAAARRRGIKLGPKFILAPASKAVKHARKLITAGEPVGEVAQSIGVSRATLYRVLRRAEGIGRAA